MIIRMKLLSDTVFGNGVSVPGGEDISVLCDSYGFPYYKGGTFKGVFREELERLLEWEENPDKEKTINELLGKSGSDEENDGKLIFSDFKMSADVREKMLEEIGENNPQDILDSLTHLRTFTSIDSNGIVKRGSLRVCRCVNKGIYFYSEVRCDEKNRELVKNVLSMIKEIGTMRNRGFGSVELAAEE